MSADRVRPPSGMVGRDAVLAACGVAVDRARGGSGGLLLVAGEPGIGKTTVLSAVAELARERGCTVVWAACPEDDAVPAFWPIVRLLSETGCAGAASAADELRGGDPEVAGQHRFVLFDRVAGAVREAAADTPLVLVLDDLHWADPSSLRLLAFLVKQVRAARVLVLASYRDTDVRPGHPLLELLAEPGTSGETLTLPGLGTDDVATLLARAGGDGTRAEDGRSASGSRAAADSIREHTGGNPFFVLHVARLLEAEGHLATSRSALPLPVGVRAVLERRLARLSQPCHELLAIASVVGARFDVALLAEVSGTPATTVTDLLGESAAARLTQPVHRGAAHEFAHALVRATVASQSSAARTAELHGRMADALLRRHGDEEARLAAIAHHELNAGAERAAARGVDAAARAGRHAVAAQAFEQAGELFARAIAACPVREQVGHLLLELGDALLRSGDWEAAAVAFSDAADVARGLGRADLFAQAALGVGADTGGFEVRLGDRRQLAMLEEALRLLGTARPELRSRLLARRAVAATNVASPADRAAWSDEAVALARQAGDGRTLAGALSAWCDVQSGPGHVDERLRTAAEMLALADTSRDGEAALTARRFRVVALLELGSPEVHQEIEHFAVVAEALAQPLYRWYVPLFRGMQALLRGELDEAERLCAQAAALGVAAGSANAEMLSATQAAAVAVERGRLEQLVDVYAASLAEHEWMRSLPIALAMAPLIDLVRGRVEQARGRLHALAAERFAVVPVDSEWLSTLSAIALAVFRIEDPVSATALYEVLLPHAGRMVVDGIAASCLDPVDYVLGRLALVVGRPDVAAAHLRAARAQAQRLGAPLLDAHAAHALATALERSDREQARELRRRAEAVLRDAGAAPVLVLGAPPAGAPQPPDRGLESARTGVFRQEGASWVLGFDGCTVRLPDAKGLHDLRHLLARPGTPVPATALQAADAPATTHASRGMDVLDAQARAAYRRRLDDLDAEIADARAMADGERAARAGDERAFLLAELTAAVGLGGRSRRMGDDTDRARKAVTMRIRNAVSRISRVHAPLGRHLSLAVRTGVLCSYEPEHAVDWSV